MGEAPPPLPFPPWIRHCFVTFTGTTGRAFLKSVFWPLILCETVSQWSRDVRKVVSWACFWTLITSVPNERAVAGPVACSRRPDQPQKNARLPTCHLPSSFQNLWIRHCFTSSWFGAQRTPHHFTPSPLPTWNCGYTYDNDVVGSTWVPSRPVPHPRERLLDLRRSASLGPVCRSCPPRQNRLRCHDLRWQGDIRVSYTAFVQVPEKVWKSYRKAWTLTWKISPHWW